MLPARALHPFLSACETPRFLYRNYLAREDQAFAHVERPSLYSYEQLRGDPHGGEISWGMTTRESFQPGKSLSVARLRGLLCQLSHSACLLAPVINRERQRAGERDVEVCMELCSYDHMSLDASRRSGNRR